MTMNNSTKKLEDFEIYQIAMSIGEDVWNIVSQWDSFAKNTLGSQLVRSTDSIAANIAEGYGRFHYKDRRQFTYFSRGSLLETKCWITKASNRKLTTQEQYDIILEHLKNLHYKINLYLKKLNEEIKA
jgi:four helix bundle protein